ncbi:MAG: hypothetical protein NZ898_06765 [Myxococcota bacterium]|nr:hypothetical protein [Myxococcota bacterium]
MNRFVSRDCTASSCTARWLGRVAVAWLVGSPCALHAQLQSGPEPPPVLVEGWMPGRIEPTDPPAGPLDDEPDPYLRTTVGIVAGVGPITGGIFRLERNRELYTRERLEGNSTYQFGLNLERGITRWLSLGVFVLGASGSYDVPTDGYSSTAMGPGWWLEATPCVRLYALRHPVVDAFFVDLRGGITLLWPRSREWERLDFGTGVETVSGGVGTAYAVAIGGRLRLAPVGLVYDLAVGGRSIRASGRAGDDQVEWVVVLPYLTVGAGLDVSF